MRSEMPFVERKKISKRYYSAYEPIAALYEDGPLSFWDIDNIW